MTNEKIQTAFFADLLVDGKLVRMRISEINFLENPPAFDQDEPKHDEIELDIDSFIVGDKDLLQTLCEEAVTEKVKGRVAFEVHGIPIGTGDGLLCIGSQYGIPILFDMKLKVTGIFYKRTVYRI